MKVEEEVLHEVLREAITDATKIKTYVNKVKELMYNMFNVTNGEVAFILNGKTPVDLMQKDMLFKVTKTLYEFNKRSNSTFDYNKLNVDDYFTESEQLVFNQKIDRNTQEKDIIIKAGNWMQVEEDQYVIKIYPNELIDDYINRNKINYNPETQRYLTMKRNKEGDSISMITFDSGACEDIFNDMYNDLYISNILALNVNPDYYAPPRVINGNIVIPSDSAIDCIDGYHRLKAAILTKQRKPEWNQPLVFFLFICDVQKACRYILEEDKKIHLSKEQANKYDETNSANFIIEKLNSDIKFIPRGTITGKKYIAINKIIEKLFEPEKLYNSEARKNAVQLFQKIKENINEYIEQNNMYDTDITKEMWFVYLNALKHSIDTNSSFLETMDKIKLDDISEISFVNTPSPKHYTIMKEVLLNV